jgi:hypothetical protein
MKAEDIRQVVAARYTQKRWAVHFEVGLVKHGRLRADVIAMHMGGGIEIIEVKSSVADFRTDKKMAKYMPYGDKMYLAVTKEVYEKIADKVLPGIGVYVVGPDSIYVAKRAKTRPVHGKKRLNIMARLAYRSADATLHTRKSKSAGRKYVADRVVNAIAALPKPRTKPQVMSAVEDALKGIV